MFNVACKPGKRRELYEAESRKGWLCSTLKLVTKEIRRDEGKWRGKIMKAAAVRSEREEDSSIDRLLTSMEVRRLLPGEEFVILFKLYVEGFTYQEVADELGINRSALAMRVHRVKKKFMAEYGRGM